MYLPTCGAQACPMPPVTPLALFNPISGLYKLVLLSLLVISRTFAYAFDHRDVTQLCLVIPREVRMDREDANLTEWESTGPGKADQPPKVALRSRTERDQA